MSKIFITFNENMISSKRNHTDEKKIDFKTGERMQIWSIKLPSSNYRTFRFGKDSNNINLDQREATINISKSYIGENKDSNGNLLNYYSYLDSEKLYNINFKGKIIGRKNDMNIFDHPDVRKVSGDEICKMFGEARKKSKELKQNKKQNKIKVSEVVR